MILQGVDFCNFIFDFNCDYFLIVLGVLMENIYAAKL